MKRIACILLASIQLALLLTGCTGSFPWEDSKPTEPADTIIYAFPSEVPTYEDNKEIPIIGFWSPPNTEEFYQGMVDCGFTDVIIDGKYGVTPGSDKMFETLAICDKVGIGAYVAVAKGYSFSADPRYAQYESFKGVNTDEPVNKANLDTILGNIDSLNANLPDATYWTGIAYGVKGEFDTFEDFLDYYMVNGGSEQGVFSICCYPLVGTTVKPEIDANWLSSLENAVDCAVKYNCDLYTYIATMSMRSITRRKPMEDDLRYQAYVSLAYGAEGIGEFCYMSPGVPPYDGEFTPNDYALIDATDHSDYSTYFKTNTWYSAQTVNMEIKSLDQVILSYDWQGIMKSVGSDAQTTAGKNCFSQVKNWTKKHDGIKKFSSTEDAIMGVFKDENGYDGFMLVNFADPAYDRENTVAIQFRGASRAMVYIKGEPQMVDLVDGTYTVTLEPGEGQFIIPLN